MAIVKSTAVQAGLLPDHTQPGFVLCRSASYTVSSAMAKNTTIQMVPIPKNARILNINWWHDGAWRTLAPFNVGDGGDADRFFSNKSVATATATLGMSLPGNNNAGLGFKYTSQDTIDFFPQTALSTLAARTIHCDVYYKMHGAITDEG